MIVTEAAYIQEKAPPSPEAEKWIRNNKAKFKEQYGPKWAQMLYGRAWKLFGNGEEGTGIFSKDKDAKKEAAGAEALDEGWVGSLLRNLATGRIEDEIDDIEGEVRDIHTPEQQRVVMQKIVALLGRLVTMRHNPGVVAKVIHGAGTKLSNMLGDEGDPAKELPLRTGEAIGRLSRLRDRTLAIKWPENEAASEKLMELRQKAREAIASATRANLTETPACISGEMISLTEQSILNELAESLAGNLTREKMEATSKKTVERQRKLEVALEAQGVDVQVVRKHAEAAAERAVERLQSEDSEVGVVDVLKQAFGEIGNVYDDLGKKGEFSAGALIFIEMLFLEKVFLIILGAMIAPVMVSMGFGYVAITLTINVLFAVFAGPYFEERARRQALQQGKGLSAYVAMLNAWEFVRFSRMMIKTGFGVVMSMSIRAFVVLMHMFWTAIQVVGFKRDTERGVDPEQAGKMEYKLAMVVHGLYNVTSMAGMSAYLIKNSAKFPQPA